MFDINYYEYGDYIIDSYFLSIKDLRYLEEFSVFFKVIVFFRKFLGGLDNVG